VCDTLVSLIDDRVVLAKNSDRDANEAQMIRWYPAADHGAGEDLRCTWVSVPQVAHTNAIVVSQPWWMWGAEMGANEWGVAIGNEAVYTTEPAGDTALLGMDLLRLALERATTADAACGVIVDLLERHGQGGRCSYERPGATYHNSFLIADRDGALVLETAGERWATERVTGRARSISNGLTITGFAEQHADLGRERDTACRVRRARTEASAEAATRVGDMFAALRDHGGDRLRWSPSNGALNGPCAHAGGGVTSTQTTSSWVSDLGDGGLHWATATAAPCTSVFHPIRIDAPIDLGCEPSNRFDPSVRWWRHEALHRAVMRDHESALALFVQERDALEVSWLDEAPPSGLAFEHSADAEATWTERVLGAGLTDRRPDWLRELWRAYDVAADMAVPAR
jgi:secernin